MTSTINESAQAALEIITPETRARVGKIARLPRAVREELNRRLLGDPPSPPSLQGSYDEPPSLLQSYGEPRASAPSGAGLEDGASASLQENGGELTILEWLNRLPEVQAVLTAEFGGRAINGPNLTAWRQGGFQAWCRHREAWERVTMVFEEAEDFAGIPERGWAADKLNEMATAALGECLREAMAMPAGAEKRRAVLETVAALGKLQRANRATERAERERETDVRAVHDDCVRRKQEQVAAFDAKLEEREAHYNSLEMLGWGSRKRKKNEAPTPQEEELAEKDSVLERMGEIRRRMVEAPVESFDPAWAAAESPLVEGGSLRAKGVEDGEMEQVEKGGVA